MRASVGKSSISKYVFKYLLAFTIKNNFVLLVFTLIPQYLSLQAGTRKSQSWIKNNSEGYISLVSELA